MRDGTIRSPVGPLVGRVWAVFPCTDPNRGNRPYWSAEQTRLAPGKEQAGSGRFDRFSSPFTTVLDSQGTLLGGGVVFWFQSCRFNPYSPAKIKENRARLGTDPTGQFSGRTSPRWFPMEFCCKVSGSQLLRDPRR
ncbi:hypothetical protein CRG98_013289 [Punica granatum]|uniref:Uncharacterized protein n=1 Tax=Punica granatum TaxID=22663 RepID=A0A2I0KCR8_PUNGR|nr:hypothetical protein CRG98_013289 [Punica granatum]